MRKRIKDGNFRFVAGIWSDNGWAVHIFIEVDGGEIWIGRAHSLSDHIPATKRKCPSFIL